MELRTINNTDKRYMYEKLYLGDYGEFFDAMGCPGSFNSSCFGSNMHNNNIFCRLKKILSNKVLSGDLLPVKTCYIQPICRIITDFCIGDGVDYVYDKKVDNSLAIEFDNFYERSDVDLIIGEALEHMLSRGMSAIRMMYSNNTKRFGFQLVKWDNIVIDSDGEYMLSFPLEYAGEKYVLQEKIIDVPEGHVILRKLFDKDGKEREGIYKKIYGEYGYGYSEKTYTVPPIIIMKGRQKDENGYGLPIYYHVLDKMQLIMFYDIMIGLENRDNLLSKIGVPKQFHYDMNDAGQTLNDINYITHEIGDVKSFYLSKSGGFLNEALKHRDLLIKDIAIQIGLPRDLFTSEQSSAIRVEAIRLAKQPFDKMMKYYQRIVSNSLRDIFRLWMDENHPNRSDQLSIIIAEKSVIQDVSTEQQQLYLQMYKDQLIDQKTVIELILPDLPNGQYSRIIERTRLAQEISNNNQ